MTVYDKLVEKVNTIDGTDTSKLVKKLAATQTLKNMRRKGLTMINILLLLILIN